MPTPHLVKDKYRDYLPQTLQLDLSTQCNLDCLICSLKKFHRQKEFINPETFQRIKPSLKHFKGVLLGCNGEPLLHRDLFGIIRQIRKSSRRTYLTLVTNATLLDQKNIDELVSSGIDEVIISFDAVRKKTFEQIRKGADLQQVINNILRLGRTKLSRKTPLPRLTLRFTANTLNIRELPELVRMAGQWKVEKIDVYNLEPYFSALKNKTLYFDPKKREVYLKILLEAAILARRANILLTCPPLTAQNQQSCVLNTVYISAQGDICPCQALSYDRPFYFFNRLLKHQKLSFGNINDAPFEKIWNDRRFVNFRMAISRGSFPVICEGCFRRNF